MDRVFLDANVLFSAAWRPNSKLRRLWSLDHVELLSSDYAIDEAMRNLESPTQKRRLARLLRQVGRVDPVHFMPPPNIQLPEKDLPILIAAIDGNATHLLTGDREHFGRYYHQELGGVMILPPAEYPPLTAEA